jgi:hypothetical protein
VYDGAQGTRDGVVGRKVRESLCAIETIVCRVTGVGGGREIDGSAVVVKVKE